jgi:hypothetical protein
MTVATARRLASVALVACSASTAQEVVWTATSPVSDFSAYFGTNLSSVKDANGDGIDDVLVGNISGLSSFAVPHVGWAGVFSGADGALLISWAGAAAGQGLDGCGGVGDVDGDGAGDVAIANISSNGSLVLGFYSVATGALLASFPGWTACTFRRLGYDWNGDGIEEYHHRPGSGSFNIWQGATPPNLQLAIVEPDYWANMGAAEPQVIEDFDGDGYRDFVLGAPGAPCSTTPQLGVVYKIGKVTVYSGSTGATLATFIGDSICDRFGHNADSLGDVDGDGVQDFIVTQPGLALVKTISGATGAVIKSSSFLTIGAIGGPYRSHFAVGDVDGDGFGDYVGCQYPQFGAGHVYEVRRGIDHGLIYAISPVVVNGVNMIPSLGNLFVGDEDEDGFSEVVLGSRGVYGQTGFVRRIALKPKGAFKYGSGCGAGTHAAPGIGARGSLKIGQTITTTLYHAPPNASAVFALGTSDAVFGTIPLPWNLTASGFPGCQLVVSPEWIQPVPTSPQVDGRAGAVMSIAIPNLPSLVGSTFYAQWAAQDPVTGAVVFSQGLRSTLQS